MNAFFRNDYSYDERCCYCRYRDGDYHKDDCEGEKALKILSDIEDQEQ